MARPPVRSKRTPPPVRTPQEQAASLDENINSIQEIMNKDVDGATEKEQAESQAALKELLDLLQKEKENLKTPQETTKATDKHAQP